MKRAFVNEQNWLIKNMSTTYTFKLARDLLKQLSSFKCFGGETYHLHVNVDRAGHGNNRRK